MRLGEYISSLWRGSIRRQLILCFALASIALMLGFGFVIREQQREMLYQSSEERAGSLAHALAISATPWALTNDLVGLQEVVQGFAKTADLQRAYFVDTRGEVLASTSSGDVGFFVTDEISRRMLESTAREEFVLLKGKNLVVVADPVLAEGRLLGWARVEMSRDTANANLSAFTRMWVEFIVLAVLAVSLIALWLGRRMTRGLDRLTKVAAAVERGWENQRADIGQADEIGVLSSHLDRMLDAIERQKELLRESEAKYRFLANNTSDVIWVVNLEAKRWEYVSPSIKKLCGYSVEEIMAQPLEHAVTPQSYPVIQAWIEERSKLFRNGSDGARIYRDEVELRCHDGSSLWTEVTTHYAMNDRGELILLGASRDITERKTAEEQIRNLAFYDTLTQLPNRRLLQDRFHLVISACKRNNRYAALMFVDLDNFKPLNDKHGHDAGDLLLVEVAHRIGSCVREVDTVARFGGDEFVVMLSELDAERTTSITEAAAVAEKIRQRLAEPYRLMLIREDAPVPRIVQHRCTASIGVVLFNDHEGSQEDIVRLADNAMYQAKSAGRDRVQFAEM